MSSQKKIATIVFITFLIILVAIGLIRKNNLRNNFAVTEGYVYELGSSRKSPNLVFLKFRFKVKNGTYTGNSGIPCNRRKAIYFQSWQYGQAVTVIYNKNNPNNNRILITTKSFREYNLTVPDKFKEKVHYADSICNK